MNALTSDEVAITQMALSTIIEDLERTGKEMHPLTPDARKYMRQMVAVANSALNKLALASGKLVKLDPYVEGDEKEFLTKQS